MPVLLGQQPDHGFDTPLGLLRDCHRRVERFLDVLIRVADESRGNPLSVRSREAWESGLHYFRTAAPRHTADEEESLFPRMRAVGGAEAEAALAKIAALESDHRAAEIAHAVVERLGQRWLAEQRLDLLQVHRLLDVLKDLRETYRRHIAVEDEQIFPLAGRILSPEQLASMGEEMARRRGLSTQP